MSASPQALHILAHRAGAQRRDESDWWGSPLETALAAVAAARHPPSYREAAERALERLLLWWDAGQPSRLSGDAAAVALAAHAAKSLGRTHAVLASDSAARVADVASRDAAIAPELHVALSVWALDALVDDREAAPWPAVRTRAARGPAYGVDAGLRAYSAAVAAHAFDAGGLVRTLLGSLPTSPSTTDAAQVAWLLTAAVERCTRALPADEPGLLALVDQRAALVERLSVELGERSFAEPDVEDFDPEATPARVTAVAVSSLEALLLDCALASRDADSPWVTFDEALSLLGERETRATARTATTRRALSVVVAVCGALAGAVVTLAAVVAGAAGAPAAAFGVAVASAGWLAAALSWRAAATRPALAEAVGVFAGVGALCAALVGVNASLAYPVFPDIAGLVVGVLVPAAASVVWLSLSRR